jgi:hypothetical protein
MTDTRPRATDGHDASAARPINDNLYAALALLRHAYDCAEDAHAAPWDFALEIGKLHEAGLTVTELRSLVAEGFVEHGAETSAGGDAHRSFTRSGGFNFSTTTCVVRGGLSVDVYSTATMTNILVTYNTARGGEGGAGASGGDGWGGGIAVGGRTIYDGADGSSGTLSDSTISDNLALGGTGGKGGNGFGVVVVVDASEVSGGLTATPSLAVSDSTMTGNRAVGGVGRGAGSAGLGIGGGVYNCGDFTYVDTMIDHNHASTSNDNVFP